MVNKESLFCGRCGAQPGDEHRAYCPVADAEAAASMGVRTEHNGPVTSFSTMRETTKPPFAELVSTQERIYALSQAMRKISGHFREWEDKGTPIPDTPAAQAEPHLEKEPSIKALQGYVQECLDYFDSTVYPTIRKESYRAFGVDRIHTAKVSKMFQHIEHVLKYALEKTEQNK